MVVKPQSMTVADFQTEHEESLVQPGTGAKAHKIQQQKFAVTSPYVGSSTPKDVLQFLPPNGDKFSLFGDPYAQRVFIPSLPSVIKKSQYWYTGRSKDNDYTDSEVGLLMFLGKHRCATRSQIARAVFNSEPNSTKVRDFLRRCTSNGVLVPFSWISPCQDERTRPHVYGLSPIAAQAAKELNPQNYIPKDFQFTPVKYPYGQNPLMLPIFNILIANEFYCKLYALDRVIDWRVNERILLSNSRDFKPQYSIRLIKDAQDFRLLWVEVVRPRKNWFDKLISRFQEIQFAYLNCIKEERPEAVILIIDHETRIPEISQLAEQFIPDVPIRFTTDELIISNDSPALFYAYSDVDGLNPSGIRFLSKDWPGMTASQYFETYNAVDDLLEDADY